METQPIPRDQDPTLIPPSRTMHIVVLDPDSTDPTWGTVKGAIVLCVPDTWDRENLRDLLDQRECDGTIVVAAKDERTQTNHYMPRYRVKGVA